VAALHDFLPEQNVNIASAASFMLRLVSRLPRSGPIVWCQAPFTIHEHGRPYAPGLLKGALQPKRFVVVSLPHPRDMGFVLEEALAMAPVAAVLGEGPPLDFTETRRLSLIAGRSGVPCLFLNTEAVVEASVALTRWRVGPLPGPADPLDPKKPGPPAWAVELTRARGGKPGTWEITWDDETHSFRALSDACDQSLPAIGDGAPPLFAATGGGRRRIG
jgi:protein ImuA